MFGTIYSTILKKISLGIQQLESLICDVRIKEKEKINKKKMCRNNNLLVHKFFY